MSHIPSSLLFAFGRELRALIKEAAASTPPQVGNEPVSKEKINKKALIGLGAVTGGVLGAGAVALRGKGVRANLMAELRNFGKGGARAAELNRAQRGLPPQAVAQAKAIADMLRAQGIDPRTAKIGIGATGGTGKSTMARALSQELGMTHIEGDNVGKSLFGRDLVSHFKKNPIAGGSIVEQSHLLTQLDPDHFDAIIHLEKPWKEIEKQLLSRGRGAAQRDFYDTKRVQRAIRAGFDHTEGPAHTITEGVRLKIKPQEGFKADTHLNAELSRRGVAVPDSMDRQARLQSLATNEPVSLPGLLPYFHQSRFAGIGAGAAAGGVASAGATNYIMQNSPTDR